MYAPVSADELRQGDIFLELPWLLFDPCKVGTQSGVVDLSETGFKSSGYLLVQAESAPGVIISADCSVARDKYLTVCRLRPLTEAESSFDSKEIKARVELKIKYQRTKVGLFYFAPITNKLSDSYAEFSEHMPFPREFLWKYQGRRIATLTEEARHHLREKIAHHHTRFGPDDSYILTDEEKEVARKLGLL